MRVTEVRVERAYTINLGNYESAKVGGSITISLNEGESQDDAYRLGAEFLDGKMGEELESLDPNTGD